MDDLPDLDRAPAVEPEPEPESHTDEDASNSLPVEDDAPDPEEPGPDGREDY